MLLGAHVSVSGGLHNAFPRGEALGCQTVQIFVKNPNRWTAVALADADVRSFRAARAESSVERVVAHGGYLLNLCGEEPTRERSIRALIDEMQRCLTLGVDALIIHPGAHLGGGEALGLQRIASSLTTVLGQLPEGPTRLLLELTAGQGTVLGYRVEQLAEVLYRVGLRQRLGVCLDTCHLHAAGVDLGRRETYEAFVAELDATLEPQEVACIHLNDSLYPLGSRKDRHTNVGHGTMGLEPFRNLLRDSRWNGTPMVLETPSGEDLAGHRTDLETLRGFVGGDQRRSQTIS